MSAVRKIPAASMQSIPGQTLGTISAPILTAATSEEGIEGLYGGVLVIWDNRLTYALEEGLMTEEQYDELHGLLQNRKIGVLKKKWKEYGLMTPF